ncbi:NAD(P)-binding protein [Athelia psychrophila]|uniref:NAD(P)-binding protein n=1 Tax=Athelia psychrophila TaxID=1759441 RepID=A0A166Q5A1_9AGAM|nr:NAD(P)-binding protein [Fibularhizoctonia sp. CBS 109695]
MSKGVALVTGSGQGIGRAISLRLADDGFDVAVNDIPFNKDKLESLVKEIESKGRKSIFVVADVSQEDQVKAMVDATVKDLGGLDIMVANAGVIHFGVPVVETTAEDFDRIFNINVKGVFFCYKYAGLQMVAQGRGGRIIGASSFTGKRGQKDTGAYSASKFAIRGLTQSMAQEVGPHRITVNSYAPGAIDTAMLRTMDATFAKQRPDAKEGDYYKMANDRCPLGYNGTPEDVASVVSYLASQEAHFITGQSISVNGGIYFD